MGMRKAQVTSRRLPMKSGKDSAMPVAAFAHPPARC